jgi:hypothetical protein
VIVHEITRDEFMATFAQEVVSGNHDQSMLLQALQSPEWFVIAIMRLLPSPGKKL